MTNHRLTVAASIAVLAAALSLYSLLSGNLWLAASIGAVAAVALAGSLTRLSTVQAAIAATACVLIAVLPPLAGHGVAGLVGGVVVVALTALSATGARILRVFATLATYLAVELFYLNVVFANGLSYGRLVPSAASVASLAAIPGKASASFQYSPPVPTNSQVDFIVAAGVALVAITVDILAVRLRRPALAGLPLLLLFSVPVASTLKSFGLSQVLTFGIGIAAYLALLSADGRQRLRMWGRLVTIRRLQPGSDGSQAPDTRQMAASGRRVGLAAVGVAMLVPVILVGATPKDLFNKTLSPGGGGGGLITAGSGIDPLGSVNSELASRPEPVLTYRTNARDPQDQYLQELVLNYDEHSGTWVTYLPARTQLVRRPQLPEPVQGLTAKVPIDKATTTITLDGVEENAALPLPYAPVEIGSVGAPLAESPGTLMVFDGDQQLGPQFTVVSDEALPTKADLNGVFRYPASIEQQYGGYNGPDASKLYKIAAAQTAGAATPLQQAYDLQQWFSASGTFSYTIQQNQTDTGSWLYRFLTSTKSGDCQQFAPAFAILARLLGIPSRVAVGYTAGSPVGDGQWTVTTSDAHAWPELYFPNAGWVRFEPTPSGANGQGTAQAPPYAIGPPPDSVPPGGTSGQTGALPPAGTGKPGSQFAGHHHIPGGDVGTAGPASRPRARFPVGLVLGIVAVLLIALPGASRWLTARRRWMTASGDAAQAHAAWRELTDYLTDYGLGSGPSESPRALAGRVAEAAGLSPAATAAVTRIGAAEERARYARTALPGEGLREDVALVRKALAARADLPHRALARLLPASTLAAAREGLESASHALSWLESPLPTLRRSLRRTAQPRRAG
ncbi:MAG TPA: transglutaminaseTgpA domain-containing protein [Streptosporangiaceae bacterium]|nr:transglutaminaseTgpA domain-containing protein [Streptosporangiaceae bacterium]